MEDLTLSPLPAVEEGAAEVDRLLVACARIDSPASLYISLQTKASVRETSLRIWSLLFMAPRVVTQSLRCIHEDTSTVLSTSTLFRGRAFEKCGRFRIEVGMSTSIRIAVLLRTVQFPEINGSTLNGVLCAILVHGCLAG